MTVIAVFNQKGGVGKTTTALNLCAALARMNADPLAIDLDPQGHLSLAHGLANVPAAQSVCEFFTAGTPLDRLVTRTPNGRRLIPATLALSKIDATYGGEARIASRLKDGLQAAFPDARQPVIVDCCPMLSVLTLNALVAADRVLIPVAADYLSLQGVDRLDSALNVLESKLKRTIERRVVVTRFDARRKLSAAIFAQLQQRYGRLVCATRITENVSLAESPMHSRNIFEYAAASPGARDYLALAAELCRDGFFSQAAAQPAAAAA